MSSGETEKTHSAVKGMVFNIMRFSVNDGPGIRTTVFLKGCPLGCPWCQNPESISTRAEIMFHEERCIRCGECFTACPSGAVKAGDGKYVISREICLRCGECAQACSSEARGLIGQEMETEEVMAEVRKDVIFYDESGGGVTFSGGEPLLQPGFLIEILKACRRENIRAAIDTTGFAPPEILTAVSDHTDLFLYDIKTMDDSKHRRFTGVSNKLILDNLAMLSSMGKTIILRIPVIPGFNDDDENILKTGRFAVSLGNIREIHLLPYHRGGSEKYKRLGMKYTMAGVEVPREETLVRLAKELNKLSIPVSIGG